MLIIWFQNSLFLEHKKRSEWNQVQSPTINYYPQTYIIDI